MKHDHTGYHSINELLELVKGLEFFRYYPPRISANASDFLECGIPYKDESQKEVVYQFVDSLKGDFPRVLLARSNIKKEKRLRIAISNRENYDDLKAHHFDDARALEERLKEFCAKNGFQLAIPSDVSQSGFDPSKYS